MILLKIKTLFASTKKWKQYDFVENQDYTLLAKIGEQYDFVENQDFITAPQKNGAFKNRSDGY